MKNIEDLKSTHKLCSVCKSYKMISSFGLHAQTKDGLRYECKDCINNLNEQRKSIIKNDDSLYSKYLEGKRISQLKYKDKYKNKHKRSHQSTINYRIKNPERESVYRKVSAAIKSGEIIKEPCCICGDINSEAHHEDYNKPLDVMWLCRIHHRQIHRKYSELKQLL